MRRATVLLCATAALLALASQAQAAAPNYILISGPGVARPVLMASWRENHELFLMAGRGSRPDASTLRGLGRRPSLDLAHFWRWSARPAPTSPRQASQHGRFYPAHRGQAAVILIAEGRCHRNPLRRPRGAPDPEAHRCSPAPVAGLRRRRTCHRRRTGSGR